MPFLKDLGQALMRAATMKHDLDVLEVATKREERISDLPASKREKPYRILVRQMDNNLNQITTNEVKVDFIQLKSAIETQKIPEAQDAMLLRQDSPRGDQCKDACFILT